MTTILDTLQKGEGYLERHGVEDARLNMQHLLAQALDCERLQLSLDFDRPMGEEVLQVLRDLVKRRGEGVPMQHLVGNVEFSDYEFKCDGRGLVPRPETEELVELILTKDWPYCSLSLEMGTGSGVSGLTLAAKVNVEQKTRSPGSTPARMRARCSAAVPLDTAIACPLPTKSAN